MTSLDFLTFKVAQPRGNEHLAPNLFSDDRSGDE